MSKHRQSREEWEQEFRDVQRNVLPHEELRSTSILARRAAEEGWAVIRGPKQLVLLLLAMLFFGVAIMLGSVAFQSQPWLLGFCAALALTAAVLLTVLALSDRRPGSAGEQSKD